MIEKQYEKYVPVCDMCGETLPECDTHNEARTAMRKAGWLTERNGDAWENYCDICVEEIYEDEEKK